MIHGGEDGWDRCRRGLSGECRGRSACGEKDIYMKINKLSRQRSQSVIMPFGPTECDCQVLPSTNPDSLRPCRKAATTPEDSLGDRLLRNPITRIAACCARAASGHAAAPPMILMKSRRLMGRALSLMITAYHIVDGGFCATAKIRPRLPKRVKLRHGSKSVPLPLFPLKTDMR